MYMKKSITATVLLLLFITVTAQVKIGVKGGWNYCSTKAVYTGVKQSTGFVHGFGAGIMTDIPFDGVLHFTPSVMVNNRGFIIKPVTGNIIKEKYSITYLDLIPALSAEFENGDNAFSITAGPVFGFTSLGNLKTTDNNNATTSQKLQFGFTDYGWFDMGLKGGVGYRVKKTVFEASYYLGLTNINNQEENDGRNIRHRMVSLTVGYYFKQTAH